MLEVECPAVTPEIVLKASGHVERFTDFMVTDVKTGDCYRADHLLEGALEAALEDKKNPLPADKAKVGEGWEGRGQGRGQDSWKEERFAQRYTSGCGLQLLRFQLLSLLDHHRDP